MKKKVLSLLLLSIVMVFTSCKKDDDDNSNNTSNNQSSMSISGTEWDESNLTLQYSQSEATIPDGTTLEFNEDGTFQLNVGNSKNSNTILGTYQEQSDEIILMCQNAQGYNGEVTLEVKELLKQSLTLFSSAMNYFFSKFKFTSTVKSTVIYNGDSYQGNSYIDMINDGGVSWHRQIEFITDNQGFCIVFDISHDDQNAIFWEANLDYPNFNWDDDLPPTVLSLVESGYTDPMEILEHSFYAKEGTVQIRDNKIEFQSIEMVPANAVNQDPPETTLSGEVKW